MFNRTTLRVAVFATGTLLSPVAGAIASASPQTSPPDPSPPVELATGSDPAPAPSPSGNGVVQVVDEAGTTVAVIRVGSVDPNWTGYAEDDAPASGHEYVRVSVTVENLAPRGLLDVMVSDFVLQDEDGFLTSATAEPTADDVAAELEPLSAAELAAGETAEFGLTFEVVSGVAADHVFFQPDYDRLVTVAHLGA